MHGDEQLFGSMPGAVVQAAFLIVPPEGAVRGSVSLRIVTGMRAKPAALVVTSLEQSELAEVVGTFMPLVNACTHHNIMKIRRMMWATNRRLGQKGFEVAISACGQEKG